jgi:predicted SprT family Zn-dependent metalloprotease
MRLLPCLSLLPCLLLATSSHASTFSDSEIAVLCESLVPRDTSTLRANESLISYRYSRTSQDLTEAVRAIRPISQPVGGTTSYKSDYTLALSPVFALVPVDGKYCYRVRADLELAKSPIEVSIASEYNEGARKCAHEAILEHEMKHVSVYQSFMRYFAGDFKRQFGATLDQVRTTGDARTVATQIDQALLPAMHKYIQSSMKRIRAINEEVDSPEEYERVRLACMGKQAK